ncbi:uncharacterized protein N7473_011592 [Penicillium subrubescens]|uniref:uncharacterized protein n=1 Tax=Penicillium subrubescens TaxID=1316194 RepID=UPI0025450523|nr:uncharacterized protein N7473_011592 [Penicillium subrubescens]KAJ5880539.1 hypothetical protein N7473_011592 [Penicillium subrubescens]
MIIRVLTLMINGTETDVSGRIISLEDPLEAAFTELMGIAILKIHRMSLIDASVVESARKAVAAVQDWFDDGYMPDGPKKEN